MIIKNFALYLFLTFTLTACGVGEESLPSPATDQNQLSLPPVQPVLGETTIIEVSENAATVRSQIEQLGRKEVFQHGHFWSEDGGTTIKVFTSSLGKRLNSGSFTSDILDLKSKTIYKVWPYVETVVGSVEGEAITFATD